MVSKLEERNIHIVALGPNRWLVDATTRADVVRISEQSVYSHLWSQRDERKQSY